MPTKETQCTSCLHADVCKYTERYLAADVAANKLSIGVKDNGVMNVRDISFIRVTVECEKWINRTVQSIKTL